MFCCSSKKSITAAVMSDLTIYRDSLSLLWLGSPIPGLDELPIFETAPKDQIKIYQVSKLAEFELACIGESFKASTYPYATSNTFSKRSFHAVIIADVNEAPARIQNTLERIQRIFLIQNWSLPTFFILPGSVNLSSYQLPLKQYFKSLTTEWKKELNDYLIEHCESIKPSPLEKRAKKQTPSYLTEKNSQKTQSTIVTFYSDLGTTQVFPPSRVTNKRPDETNINSADIACTSSFIDPRHLQLRAKDSIDLLMDDLKSKTVGPAEFASVAYHQKALLEAFDMDRLTERGLTKSQAFHFRLGLIYSDMGKLEVYKKWLKDPCEDSSALLDSLQLKSESPLSTLFREITGNKPFLNPDFSHEEIYLIFKAVPTIVTYFHEFPGMRVAERQLLEGKITSNDFREIILSFYGHNGPGDPSFEVESEKPFWATIPQSFLSRINDLISTEKLPQKVAQLFAGTVFIQDDGVFRYYDPQCSLGYEHMIFDRFDGYRNSIKIREEIRFLPSIEAEVETLLGPNYNTHLALDYDEKVVLPRMLQKGLIDESEFLRLRRATRKLKERVEFIHDEICKFLPDYSELRAQLKTGQRINSIDVQYFDPSTSSTITRRFKEEDIGNWDSPSASLFRNFIDIHVRYPVMQRDRELFGIYNDFYILEKRDIRII